MSETTKYPNDLAKAVWSVLGKGKSPFPPSELLTYLFESMYFASLKSEESEPITFHIVYIDPVNPDPDPPERLVLDRWSYVKFPSPILFNLPNVVKLAKASDPRTSSLAVFHDDNENILIWGLIDQGNRYHDFVNYEVEAGPERPGLFQASIEAPGHIVAYVGYKKIAELRVNKLVRTAVDVFRNGPVHEALQPGIDNYVNAVIDKVDPEAYRDRPEWESSLTQYWISSLCRLLLRIKSHRHGGALLITPKLSKVGLNVKYPLNYGRLKSSLISRARLTIESTYASDRIFEYWHNDRSIPISLYLNENVADSELSDVRSEIDGALWFISLLSRVDGLVLMNKYLRVRGFGVEIKTSSPPEKVVVSTTRSASETSLQEVQYTHFGTRHRSMMRYCWKYPGSVGFVMSQDGDVRVMTRVAKSLVVWDNIKLQMYTFVRRKRRSIIT